MLMHTTILVSYFKNREKIMNDTDLIARCGLYCGTCRAYLLLKKDLFEEKGYKQGCKGCKIRNKNCAFLKKKCTPLRKGEYEYCSECEEMPCPNLKKLNDGYEKRYGVSLVANLERLREVGEEKWIKEQIEFYKCPECGGDICVHDDECYDCGLKYNQNKV